MHNLFKIEKLVHIPAIYIIKIKNHTYIGSTISLSNRLYEHRTSLKNNKHYNSFMQNAFNKYGENYTEFKVLEYWSLQIPYKKELLVREKYWINKLKPDLNSKLDPVSEYNCKVNSKPVYQYDLDGNFLAEFESASQASRFIGVLGVYKIALNATKDTNTKGYKSAGGYQWSYEKKEKIEPYKNKSNLAKSKKVTVYNIEGFKIKTFNSIAECVKTLFKNKNFTNTCAAISGLCYGRGVSMDDYRFSYDDREKLDNKYLLKIKKNYPIVQYDQNMNYIKTWNTWKDVKKHFNFSRSLNEVMNSGKYKSRLKNTIYNFIWKRLQ